LWKEKIDGIEVGFVIAIGQSTAYTTRSFDYLTFNYHTRMRKIIYIIIIFLIVNTGYAQLTKNREIEIKTNLFNIAAAGPSAALEFRLAHNWSSMLSVASGHIDYGDFGGLTKYHTITFECRKYDADKFFFIGPYLKNIKKQVDQKSSYVAGTIPFTIGKNRDFTGNCLSAGASFGVKFPISRRLNLELNNQTGFGHYYTMKDKGNNLPSGNYLDERIALWIGFRL
jgi:hypothetical protein